MGMGKGSPGNQGAPKKKAVPLPIAPVKPKPLSRSSIEAYAFGIIAIVVVVFPMTMGLRVALLFILAGLVIDLIHRSPLTIKLSLVSKSLMHFFAIGAIAYLGWVQAQSKTPDSPQQARVVSAPSIPAPTARAVLPGMSISAVLRLRHLPVRRRKYIFDFGSAKTGRLSVYVSSDSIFTLSFLDIPGETHSVQIPLGGDGIPLEEFFSLECEIGIDGQSTKLFVSVNGKDKEPVILPFRVDVSSLDIGTAVLGADINKRNGASFDLEDFGIFYNTLDGQSVSQLSFNAKSHGPPAAYASFNGSQWMQRGVDNNFTQEVETKRPILKVGKQ